jgi:hypothetical protein
MFTIEIKINGAMIGHISGVNKGLDPEGKGESIYEVDYYKTESRQLAKGTIRHFRGNGIEHLVCLILEELT